MVSSSMGKMVIVQSIGGRLLLPEWMELARVEQYSFTVDEERMLIPGYLRIVRQEETEKEGCQFLQCLEGLPACRA